MWLSLVASAAVWLAPDLAAAQAPNPSHQEERAMPRREESSFPSSTTAKDS